MIFQRAALREFTNIAGGLFVALFAITLTTQLIRLLGEAAGGQIAPEGVIALIGFAALNYLPIILSLTLFLSILLSLNRSYRDSEMIIWFASGLPITAWIRPVLIFALPLIIAIAALSLFLSPWALSKSEEFRNTMDNRNDVSRIMPGAFSEQSGTERIFFVEQTAGQDKLIRNVFVSSIDNGKLSVIVSNSGYQETQAKGDRFLILKNGRRYEGTPGSPEYHVMEFETYAVRIKTKTAKITKGTPHNEPVSTLIMNPSQANKGELLWRIGLPLSALNLALLAIPLSFINPRARRTYSFIIALLTYMIYNNLISISQAWVSQGKTSFALGWWLVHATMLIVIITLFAKQLFALSWAKKLSNENQNI